LTGRVKELDLGALLIGFNFKKTLQMQAPFRLLQSKSKAATGFKAIRERSGVWAIGAGLSDQEGKKT
jgi:hypothetical protein